MKPCDLCSTRADDLVRVSGKSFCGPCRTHDPTTALLAHGIEVEWDTQLMRVSAGFGIPNQPPDFELKCVPEVWHHKLAQLVKKDLQTGDAVFDDAIKISTNDDSAARALLSDDGIQSAILALLSGVRKNELASNHVTIKGATLLVSTRPEGGLPEAKEQEIKLEATALALSLLTRAT